MYSLSLSLSQVGDDPMMAQVQLVAQKKLTSLREKEKELQQEVRFHSIVSRWMSHESRWQKLANFSRLYALDIKNNFSR